MYDRPTASELIEAARQHLEMNVIPAVKDINHKLYFQTLVAINVLRIVEREMALSTSHERAAWERLDALLGVKKQPDSREGWEAGLAHRNAALCASIRSGNHDTDQALFEHLMATTREQLEVANPKYLQALAAEDAAG
jgi:hypothetical protein